MFIQFYFNNFSCILAFSFLSQLNFLDVFIIAQNFTSKDLLIAELYCSLIKFAFSLRETIIMQDSKSISPVLLTIFHSMNDILSNTNTETPIVLEFDLIFDGASIWSIM